jgi:type IV pilus assembly protein PilQ
MRSIRRLLVLALVTSALVVPAPMGRADEPRPATARLEDVSVVAQGDATVVRLKTSAPRRYRADLIDTPDRLVLDLEDTLYAVRAIPAVAAGGPLVQIRGSQYRKGVARVVLELRSRLAYSVREESDALVIVLGASPTPVVTQAAPAPPVPPPAPVAPPPAAGPAATAGGETRHISLEFKDAEVVNLLRILAAESGSNLVIGEDVKGKMSISLRNVPWTLALETILEARGLRRVDRDGVIRIVSVEQLTKEREARAKEEEARVKAEEAKAKAQAEIRTKTAEAELKEQEVQQRRRFAEAAVAAAIERGPLTEAAIRLMYADPGDVANTLQGLLGLGTQTIPSCREEIQGKERETRTLRLRGGGGVTSGPIAEPPFSQLFGPPRPELPPAPEPPPPSDGVLAQRVSVRAHCATNTLFVRLHAADLERVRRLIRESLDTPSSQVKIEARMEILDREDLFVIGVQWGGGGVLATDNRNVIVGRGFTSDFLTNPPGLGIPAAGLGTPSNPNLQVGGQDGRVIPVSAQSGLPLGGNLINLPIGALLNNAATTGGAGGITFGIIGSKLNINLTLEALRTQGKTFTLARPDIVTLENREARISLGEEIPFATVSSAGTQIQFKEAVLQLIVTPTVIREAGRNRIKMSVLVENNARGTPVNLGTSGAPPAIQRRRAETEVLIGDGDHLVIGGITTSLQQEQIRKVPVFGDIPIIGWLFKQRGTQETRRELVVFITPSVLRTEARPTPAVPQAPPQPPAR